MLMKIITLKFDRLIDSFNDSVLIDFIKDKDILSIKEHFFIKDEIPYLVIIVIYRLKLSILPAEKETGEIDRKKEKKNEKWRELLKEEDMPLFNTLRNWRNERCKKDGVPPYVICNNTQLAIMINKRPQSLNALSEIRGFGRAKVEKYGSDLINILSVKEEIIKKENNDVTK